ncbi:MAG: hypothetical protein SWX82_28600 [Cyanobacteriota bacterium]|nr:hypothetical protein [Cyanobacteriota bacterium]
MLRITIVNARTEVIPDARLSIYKCSRPIFVVLYVDMVRLNFGYKLAIANYCPFYS